MFAEGRIADDEFKSKFEALDKLGRTTRDNQFQVVDRSWIDTHIKTDMTLQDVANDIFSQLAQGKKEV